MGLRLHPVFSWIVCRLKMACQTRTMIYIWLYYQPCQPMQETGIEKYILAFTVNGKLPDHDAASYFKKSISTYKRQQFKYFCLSGWVCWETQQKGWNEACNHLGIRLMWYRVELNSELPKRERETLDDGTGVWTPTDLACGCMQIPCGFPHYTFFSSLARAFFDNFACLLAKRRYDVYRLPQSVLPCRIDH